MNITDKNTLENEFEKFKNAIIKARDISTKKSKRKQHHEDLPQDILDLINNKNNIRGRWKTHRAPGPDGTHNKLIKNISKKSLVHLHYDKCGNQIATLPKSIKSCEYNTYS